MKTTVIYHSADFDGIFCREIARKFLGNENVEYIGWNFGDEPRPIPSEGTIYVMDLPVDQVFGGAFHASGTSGVYLGDDVVRRLIWIDHHKSSIETHPKYIPGYRIDGVAACRLVWQWFKLHEAWDPREPHPPYQLPVLEEFIARMVVEPLAVLLAGEYDIWDKRDPRADLFQHGLRSRELDAGWWAQMLDTEPAGSFPVLALLEGGQAIAYAKANENKSIIEKNGFTVQWEGLTFLCCNAGQYNSHLFEAGIRPEHDGLLGFCLRKSGRWSVSLYGVPGKPDIDFSVIARKHGGGGHKQACGFQCETLVFMS